MSDRLHTCTILYKIDPQVTLHGWVLKSMKAFESTPKHACNVPLRLEFNKICTTHNSSFMQKAFISPLILKKLFTFQTENPRTISSIQNLISKYLSSDFLLLLYSIGSTTANITYHIRRKYKLTPSVPS